MTALMGAILPSPMAMLVAGRSSPPRPSVRRRLSSGLVAFSDLLGCEGAVTAGEGVAGAL
jgi:hypothetical protein